MKKIIWLASYPKSGNTWVRLLLTNYLGDSGTPASINNLVGGMASSWTLFENATGLKSSLLSSETVLELRPVVYRFLASQSPKSIYLKVHDMMDPRLVPNDVTQLAVYIVRDPRDVAVSFASHLGAGLDRTIKVMADTEFYVARPAAGIGIQMPQLLGSWSSHVLSWVNSSLPLKILRYEDLKEDPNLRMRELLEASGIASDSSKLDRAVSNSHIDVARKQERDSGFAEAFGRHKQFFGRGEAGAWRGILSNEQVRLIEQAHGPVMKSLGYTLTCSTD